MRLHKLLFIFLIISSIFPSDTGGRSMPQRSARSGYAPRNNLSYTNTVEFNLKYNFFVPGDTHRLSLIVALPRTLPDRQKILSTKFSTKPARIFNENSNRYA